MLGGVFVCRQHHSRNNYNPIAHPHGGSPFASTNLIECLGELRKSISQGRESIIMFLVLSIVFSVIPTLYVYLCVRSLRDGFV